MITLVTENCTQTVEVREHQSVTIECAPDVAAAMHTDGHVVVSPSITAGGYEVKARHKVGVLRYGTLELRIVPKVPVARLLYLASFQFDEKAWLQVEALLEEVDDPLSAIAQALVFHSRRVCSQHLYKVTYPMKSPTGKYVAGSCLSVS